MANVSNFVSLTRNGENLVITVKMPLKALPPKVRDTVTGEYVTDPTWDPNGIYEHTIYVPIAALDDRMRGYGLSTRLDALIAILREHYKRLNDLPTVDTGKGRIDEYGGLRTDIEIKVPTQVRTQIESVLTQLTVE